MSNLLFDFVKTGKRSGLYAT